MLLRVKYLLVAFLLGLLSAIEGVAESQTDHASGARVERALLLEDAHLLLQLCLFLLHDLEALFQLGNLLPTEDTEKRMVHQVIVYVGTLPSVVQYNIQIKLIV